MASWELLVTTFGPEPENGSKWLPGNFLGRLFGMSQKMLQNGFLGASWPTPIPTRTRTTTSTPTPTPSKH